MNLKIRDLSNDSLLNETRKLVAEEKRVMHLVLEHIWEIDDRKLFLARGYPSLFEFVVRELGYDEASAYRRISAMRAMREVPEVKVALEKGDLTLSTVSLVQAHLREESRERKLERAEKAQLFARVAGKSKRETERYLMSLRPERAMPEKVRP